MRCPILIAGSINKVIASGPFIRQVQEALQRVGHDPGPIDGQYGPRSAQAMAAFQSSRMETMTDRAWSQVLPGGVSVAGCATYRALGLPCEEVYCDIAILGAWLGDQGRAAAVCTAAALAADQGIISLRCPGGITAPGIPPTTPLPGGIRVPTWALIGIGAVVVGGLVFWAVRSGRR